jgi:hypothetical protein
MEMLSKSLRRRLVITIPMFLPSYDPIGILSVSAQVTPPAIGYR